MGLKQYLSGLAGEERATKFLKKNKYKILVRNFHSKYGEIDIIALKDEILHFIEVKATNGDYEASERLNPKKYEKLVKTINYYILKHGVDYDYSLDLLCVFKDDIKIYENISY